MKLISARIRNFKSLEDVTLNFRDLTIIVGANATGKSNCLKALEFLNELVKDGSPSSLIKIQENYLRTDIDDDNLTLEINLQEDKIPINYQVTLSINDKVCSFAQENLKIDEIKVIEIANNQGKVWDEDGQNKQVYQSSIGNLALKSAGNFGKKPITSTLNNFIDEWKFYNFDPDMIRRTNTNNLVWIASRLEEEENPKLELDSYGSNISIILLCLSFLQKQKNELNEFNNILNAINQELNNCLGISLKQAEKNKPFIKVQEIDGKEIDLFNLSDGTLRIITYYILLYQIILPPLIGIEEPERNLHPAMLPTVASILKRLSQRTQVIITTHSSQLLDCFSSDEINSDISVLLLSKKDASGTQVFRLDELSKKRADLAEWMQDFGVGSAVYHSNLLQELLEPQYA
ncbi:MAG: AAA family ATPase [Snowella sp.]|nr:AAA family ATPase [Snowella sp.]